MDIREDLRFISATVDANLRHAEAKHTSFIAFNGLAMFGGFGALRTLSAEGGGGYLQVMLIVTMLMVICAIISGIYSFMPVIIKANNSCELGAGDNALFFEDVKKHSVDSYIRLLCETYQASSEEILPLDRCVISHIIANAQIASRKFALFKYVAFFDLAAVILGLGGFLLAALLH